MNTFSFILMLITLLGYPIWIFCYTPIYSLKFKLLITALGELIFIFIFLKIYLLLLLTLFIYWIVWCIYVKRNR